MTASFYFLGHVVVRSLSQFSGNFETLVVGRMTAIVIEAFHI